MATQDRSNIVTIATCALTGTFITVFIARQIMKAIVFRKVAVDDLFILLGTVSDFVSAHDTESNPDRLSPSALLS